MNYNKTIVGGNVTRKPEVRFTQGGTSICSFGVAVNRKFKKGDEWVQEVTFIDVTIFGKRGEAFAKFHDKGTACFIEGRLRLEKWQDKATGEQRQKLSVIGEEWQFVGAKGERQAQSAPVSSDDGGGFLEEEPF